MQAQPKASQLLVSHFVIMVTLTTGPEVHARPCLESGDFELCLLSKSSLHDEEVVPDIREQFNPEYIEPVRRPKYEIVFKREMRDTEGEHKKCIGCDDYSDVAVREDHFTQHLSEMHVNTDSEITSLQESDVEATKEQTAGKDDGYFAFLTGDEQIFEVEGVWSFPAHTIVEQRELLV